MTYEAFRNQQKAQHRAFVVGALARCQWDVAATAKRIQVHVDDLQGWIAQMDIKEPV